MTINTRLECIDRNAELNGMISSFKRERTAPSSETASKIFLSFLELQAQVNALEFASPDAENSALVKSLEKTCARMQNYIYPCIEAQGKALIEQQLQEGSFVFLDTPASPLSSAFPCKFEFDGKFYQNAESCFQAQKFTDRPKIMKLFAACKTAEKAESVSQLYEMTEARKLTWEDPTATDRCQNDVLMHVLRAKFGQNPELKDQLLATGHAYIVCQGHNSNRCDVFNGSGQNTSGINLMRLRKEFGGTGVVELPANNKLAAQCLAGRCHLLTNDPFPDLVFQIITKLDPASIPSLSCVNKHWNKATQDVIPCIAQEQLVEICSPTLTIIDAKALGVVVDDEPPINNCQVLKWVRKVGPEVEGNEGLTLLTMTKDLTLNKLKEIAKAEGKEVGIQWNEVRDDLGKEAVVQTYRAPLTNSVFLNSRNKNVGLQQKLVEERGCGMPTIQENVALCVYRYKIFKKCVYRIGEGNERCTYGCTTTQVDVCLWVVGASSPERLTVNRRCNDSGYEEFGAGGRWKF